MLHVTFLLVLVLTISGTNGAFSRLYIKRESTIMQGGLKLAHGVVISDASYLTNLDCLGILLEILTSQY